MATQQDDEVEILARAVTRLSTELADKMLECERYRNALDRIATDEFVRDVRAVARKALTP